MHASVAVPRVQPGCGPACASALPFSSKPTQRLVCLQAVRQGPEPWDVLDPIQQTTAPTWQQRQQQQQQQQQRGRFTRQQRGKRSTSTSPQDTQQLQQDQSNGGRFSDCRTIQQLYTVLQQQVRPQQQQLQAGIPLGSILDASSSQLSAAAAAPLEQPHGSPEQLQLQQQQALDAAAPIDQPAQLQLLPLSAQDCVAVVNQLGAIMRSQHSSNASSANPFVEDQALQHSLALVYALIEQQQLQQQPGSILPAQQLVRCVSTLAGFKYAQQAQLAAWLEAAAAVQPAQAAAAPAPGASVPAGAAAGSIGSYRQVLAGLRMRELSTLIANLARSGVRPTNVWLLAFMQVAQQKLSTADLPQLAQLLSGLVRVGVKPTTAWLDIMESRAVQCLLEHAVRQQLPADQQQQQQAGPLAVLAVPGNGNASRRQQQQRGRVGGRSPAACQLHDVAQLLSALAEARHTPKPQLAAVLWSATAGSLAASDAAALVELMAALGALQLVPPVAWLQQYFAAAGSTNVLQQYRPWQLAGTVAAVGRLAAASRRNSAELPQQQQIADVSGCQVWAAATLAAVQQQLPTFAARDLSALLSGLASLQPHVGAAQVQMLLSDLQGKLPRLNTAGLADVTEAVAAFARQQQQGQQPQAQGQQQQQQQQQQGSVLSCSSFMEALLREVAVKLPVFPAEDLARVLLAVAAAGGRPSQLWLQAAAAQLSSKLTVLPATTLASVLDALVALGASLEGQWVLQATAALDGRLTELSEAQLQQLLALLVAVAVAPTEGWLDRADHAAQQLSQQQGVPSANVSGQQKSCQELVLQLRQKQAQQKGEAAEASSSTSSGTVHTEMNG